MKCFVESDKMVQVLWTQKKPSPIEMGVAKTRETAKDAANLIRIIRA